MTEFQLLDEISRDSILIDTNMVIPLLDKDGLFYADTQAKIKMAALTCQHFLMLDSVERELRSRKKFEEDANQLLDRKIFKKVNAKDVYSLYDRRGLQDFGHFYASSSLKPRTIPAAALTTDMDLLLASNKLAVPILTRDRDIIQLSSKGLNTSTLSFELPFPFDSDAIKEIDLDELADLGEPLRKIYRKAFEQIKLDFTQIESLKEKSFRKNDLLKKHRQLANDIKQELQNAHKNSNLWENISRPNLGETIIWTVIEMALGFFPAPIPTSPFNHIIQLSRYKKVRRKTTE